MSRFPLKRKIIIATVFTGLFLCLILSLIIFWYLDNQLTSQKINEIVKLNTEQVHESTQIFEKDKIFTKMLGTRTRVKEFLLDSSETRKQELLGIFSDYVKEDSKYLAIYLLDKKGIGLISTDERFVGQDYSFRDYFKKALMGEPAVDVLMGETSNQFGYYFSYPVQGDNNSVLGVLVVKIDNKEIDKAILNSEISKDSTTMLVDQYGIVLVSTRSERFLKSLGNITSKNKEIIQKTNRLFGREIESLQYENIQQIIDNYQKNETVEFYDQVDNENEVVSVVKFLDLPFYLVSEIGLENIQNLIFSTIFILILIVILGVFFASFLVYKLAIFLFSPLEKFRILSEAISMGDFSQKININTKDEFGDLALAFNKMTSNLDDLYKNLDKKVKERTLEIETKSKEMEDQKSAILNILEDVEIEKNKAESLASIVRDANEPIVSQDLKGTILSWNYGAEDFYQYKAEEVVGRSIEIIIPQEKLEEYKKIKERIIAGEKVEHYQTIRRKKDGNFVDVAISLSSVKDLQGKIIGVSVITLDITKEKEIDKAKTEFVSLASHQLRTPLSAIGWYSEMLLGGDAGKLNPEQERYLKEVYAGNKRMVALIDALLNVSRLDLGTFIIEPKLINVVEMAKSILFELKGQILDKKITIKEFYAKNISEFQADQNLLHIVFQNILSNAVKYTPENGKVEINILIISKGENFGGQEITEDSLAISVSDSGIGIPFDQKDKIFLKLFRADNVKESETEGTGLGLYIVKSIIDKAGGKIWFSSKEKEGTIFYIIFPATGMVKKEGSQKIK